ncbi:MAG TPA: hypothetical protein VH859_08580 [Candidatus Limnocylindria bacterium]|jgi:hypothetical protein
MHLILSLIAGVAGSAFGAGARMLVDGAERGAAPGTDGPIVVNGSIVAALAGGLLGAILGARRAFWLAAVLSAAGAERLDRRLLSRAGVDYGALVERAMETARQARSAAEDAMSGIGDEDAPPETA